MQISPGEINKGLVVNHGDSTASPGRERLNYLFALQQECGGVIPFERFMKEALYHPEHGYYSKNIATVGAGGDFSTSATLDPCLGAALAAWITHRSRELGWWRIPVIEIGAGSGHLAESILSHLSWKMRWRIDYMIHELSPGLKKEQKRRLSRRGVQWIKSLPLALGKSRGKALMISNELVDAFPCRLFQKISEVWQEVGVSISEERGLSERLLQTTHADPWFSQFIHLPQEQRVERFDSYREWLDGWSSHWNEGAFLTIDYGEIASNLYKRRPSGSLRAYYRHQRFTGSDLYARFGKQDLTADVNFSDLILWGGEVGFHTVQFQTQGEFIQSWIRKKHLEKKLPDGAREAFKVLEQHPKGKTAL